GLHVEGPAPVDEAVPQETAERVHRPVALVGIDHVDVVVEDEATERPVAEQPRHEVAALRRRLGRLARDSVPVEHLGEEARPRRLVARRIGRVDLEVSAHQLDGPPPRRPPAHPARPSVPPSSPPPPPTPHPPRPPPFPRPPPPPPPRPPPPLPHPPPLNPISPRVRPLGQAPLEQRGGALELPRPQRRLEQGVVKDFALSVAPPHLDDAILDGREPGRGAGVLASREGVDPLHHR